MKEALPETGIPKNHSSFMAAFNSVFHLSKDLQVGTTIRSYKIIDLRVVTGRKRRVAWY